MRGRFALFGVAALVALLWATWVPIAGQAPSGAAPKARPAAGGWTAKTAWGDPDLQGIWSYATITPLERPNAAGEKAVLTEEEAEAIDQNSVGAQDRRASNPEQDVAQAYNAFWWDRGKSTGRTSLIMDPENGRLPPLTDEARKKLAERAEYRRAHPADSWEDRSLAERCIVYHGVPPLPTGYNNNYQIVQTPGLVTILDENIHDVRSIPLDGRPHLPPTIRQWNGDSRGHFEGDTLVVETTNYHEKTTWRFPGSPQTLRAIERFRRISRDQIDYRFTIDDPGTYTRPWTAALPMNRIEGPIYEYACHEGNYGLAGMLRGARVQEEQAARGGKPSSK
jgi:hypothetical protein